MLKNISKLIGNVWKAIGDAASTLEIKGGNSKRGFKIGSSRKLTKSEKKKYRIED